MFSDSGDKWPTHSSGMTPNSKPGARHNYCANRSRAALLVWLPHAEDGNEFLVSSTWSVEE